MKKALLVLLILGVAGGLFAQEGLTVTGSVTTGLWIALSEDDIPVYADDDDSNDAVHASLTAAYAAERWGLKIALAAGVPNAPITAPGSFSFGNAYGWMKFFDKLLDVKAGLIDDAVWDTGGEYDTNVSNGLGIRVEVTPIDGLNVGAFFNYPKHTASDTGSDAGKIGNFLQQTAFGFQYDTGGFFNVAAALKLYSEEDEYTDGDGTDMKLIFKLGFPDVVGINILVDGGVDHLAKYSDKGDFVVYEEFGYSVGKLALNLLLGERLTGPGGFIGFKVRPKAEYPVTDNISVGIEVPVTLGSFDSAVLDADTGDLTIGVGAWVQYSFVPDTWLKFGFGLENANDETAYSLKLIFKYAF